jgi:hypothetical protein
MALDTGIVERQGRSTDAGNLRCPRDSAPFHADSSNAARRSVRRVDAASRRIANEGVGAGPTRRVGAGYRRPRIKLNESGPGGPTSAGNDDHVPICASPVSGTPRNSCGPTRSVGRSRQGLDTQVLAIRYRRDCSGKGDAWRIAYLDRARCAGHAEQIEGVGAIARAVSTPKAQNAGRGWRAGSARDDAPAPLRVVG